MNQYKVKERFMLRAYSAYDLIGYNRSRQETFIDRLFSLLISPSSTIDMSLTIPKLVYLRTKWFCEDLYDEQGVQIGTAEFLDTLYNDFIKDSSKQDPLKLYHSIKSWDFSIRRDLTIHDYQNNIEYCKEEQEPAAHYVITIPMKRKLFERGEIILAEWDELFGHDMDLEQLVAALWIQFIEQYKRGDNKRAMAAFKKKLINIHAE
jgi:hypothetical protein